MNRILHLSRWSVAVLALVLTGLATPGMVCAGMADCDMDATMNGCPMATLGADHCSVPVSRVTTDCCHASAPAAPAVATDGSPLPARSDATVLPALGDAPTLDATPTAAPGASPPDDGARPAGRALLLLHQTFLS